MQNDELGFETVFEVYEFFETAILSGDLPLDQTTPLVQRIYSLGYWAGHEARSNEITQALHERDIYYRVAARGGFGAPRIKNQGKTFAQLQALRNNND